ncbi:MAG: AAA family ATPase, partial [Chloroflexi bacterium]|nr:AAA family ATPase [Chloroflexota bacterium]
MTNGLEIKLLGSPEVLTGGQPVKFATRKVLALFVYLLVEKGAHPREKLQAMFWPESETRQAQSALRTTLGRIKDAFTGQDVSGPLRMDGDRVSLNTSIVVSLDLELAARATAETQPVRLAPSNVALVESAAQVSRGPFMDGFSLPDAPAFDEWLTIQRANWARRQNLVYERLSFYQLENYMLRPAIETLVKWLMSDYLNEGAYQRLMRLHFLNGDRPAALQTYETCRKLLAQELGFQPSPETEDLLAYIRSSQSPVLNAEPEAATREVLVIPFVGRSHEYQGLLQSLRLTRKGQPQVVIVSGESGIGKTRLADEFLMWAGSVGADVLRGRAFETSGKLLPYQLIIDALRERMERENAPEDLLDDTWLAELTRILPELRERYPDLPPAVGDDSTTRARLFEAIARLTEALAARHPLVWLMDDLQWADAETLELVHYLSRNWRKSKSPVLLLILMRSEALGHGAALRDWTSGLIHDIPITRFQLAAMEAGDVSNLIASLAGEHAPGVFELSAWFTAETAGQPFFLTETLTALDEYGALVWEHDGKLNPLTTLANLKSMDIDSLAPAIRDVVLARLEWLSQSAASMLSAAAVIGRNCSFERLQQISGLAEEDSLNSLDELLAARMIVEVRNEARPYGISHDRIREVVYARLSEARQKIFHRRALVALTEVNAPPAELAHHAISAKEWGFAFQHSLTAGDDALGLFAVTGALQHYETALGLINEKQAVVDDVTRLRLFMGLGRANEFIGNYAKA